MSVTGVYWEVAIAAQLGAGQLVKSEALASGAV